MANGRELPAVPQNTGSYAERGAQDASAEEQLTSSILKLSADLSGERELTAPVRLPRQDALTVRLVNYSLLEAYDELRQEVLLFGSFLSASAGAFVSFVANVVMGSSNPGVWLTVGASGMSTIVFAALTWRARRKSGVAKARMLASVLEAEP